MHITGMFGLRQEKRSVNLPKRLHSIHPKNVRKEMGSTLQTYQWLQGVANVSQ